jgi:ABC-type thiamin/hydroxymethylpyrimidine transport system permease subunit
MQAQTPTRTLVAWKTRDLMVTLAISLAIGIAFIPLNNIYTAITAVNPIAGWAMSGLFALPQFFIGYVIRRPGTMLLYAFVSGTAWAMASPFGLFGLIASLIGGLMSESTQWAATRYRAYGPRQMGVWAVLLASFGILVAGVLFGGLIIAPIIAISAAVASIITHVIAALLVPSLARALARTGVLGGTVVGQELQQDV